MDNPSIKGSVHTVNIANMWDGCKDVVKLINFVLLGGKSGYVLEYMHREIDVVEVGTCPKASIFLVSSSLALSLAFLHLGDSYGSPIR